MFSCPACLFDVFFFLFFLFKSLKGMGVVGTIVVSKKMKDNKLGKILGSQAEGCSSFMCDMDAVLLMLFKARPRVHLSVPPLLSFVLNDAFSIHADKYRMEETRDLLMKESF